MKFNNLLMTSCAFALLAAAAIAPAAASIKVVASSPELADITKEVGGNKVAVYSVAKPNQDYHMIEPRPSDVSKISRARMVVRIGLDLDMWMDALINAAGNGVVNKGATGYVDASVGVPRLEVPHEQVTGASGDIHVYGNPHYFYDPENGKIIAKNILQGLERVDAQDAPYFRENYKRFAEEIDRRTQEWKRELAPYRGWAVVTYHDSAIYFIRRFGLKQFGELEPKPGIPPTAPHIKTLIGRMKANHIKAVVVDSIYSTRFPDLIKRETGANYFITPYSVGSLGTKNYFDLIQLLVDRYKAALNQ